VSVLFLALVITQGMGMIAAYAKEGDSAGPPTTTLNVQPTLVAGNPTCQTLTQSGNEFKIEGGLGNGVFDDPDSELVVTISGFNDPAGFFDWSSNVGIDAVFVKGGPGGDLYEYNGATADTDLHPPFNGNTGMPYGISHISFCWTETPTKPTLSITKAASSNQVSAGAAFTYTITVKNTGNVPATGVVITDDLANSLTGVSASFDIDPGSAGGTGSCTVGAGNTISCAVGTLAADDGGANGPDQVVVTISATAPNTCVQLSNTATVDSDQTSPQTSNGVTVTITGCAPTLSITKAASSNQVSAGAAFTYTITVKNTGNVPATGVVITDDLANSLTGVSASFDIDPGSAGGTGSCTVGAGNTISCAVGTLAADDGGANGPDQVVVTISATAPNTCVQLSNTATVDSDQTSPQTSNGVTVTITGCAPTPPPPPPTTAGIEVVKGGPTVAHVGDTITYTFAVSLAPGSVTLTNIALVDPICSATPTLLSKTGGDQDAALETGETWNYRCTHVVTATDPDPLPNTVTVTGTGPSGQVSDSDSHSVDIIHPDIRIVKTANPGSIGPGETVTYTFKVTNTGDVTLFDVKVTDDRLGHICTIGRLDVGETRTCTADFTASSDFGGPLVNVGEAKGHDVTGVSVQDTDRVSIDVVLGKTVTPPVTPPSGLAFTGPSDLVQMAGVALLMLVLGSGILFFTRRREVGTEA
jgi:uncharacterized repeat protein (TIGR01451 family)